MSTNQGELQVVEKIQETKDVVTLRLLPTSGDFSYEAGQFITLVSEKLGPQEIRRSYSISSAPAGNEMLSITVKRQSNGAFSRFLHDKIQVGDHLQALLPAGQFVLPPDFADLLFIGGGSGITPLFSLIKQALYSNPHCHVALLYANRDERGIIFKTQLQELQLEFGERFRCHYFLSNPQNPLTELAPATATWAHLSNEHIELWAGTYLSTGKKWPHVFLCGPEGLMLKAEMELHFLGFPSDHLHREIFQIKTVQRPEAHLFPPCTAEIELEDRVVEVPVYPGQTILEATQQAGLDLPFSCKSGICTTCSLQLLAGKVAMYTQNGYLDTDQTMGLSLICVGYPLTEQVALKKIK